MRAIIMAAGMGTRLRPLTDNCPKSLVKVAGQPIMERQIEFLREKGIEDIIIVTGYMADKFQYLKEKYGVNLIYNDKYNVYNNIYTMYLVRDYLKNSYVTEADVYMTKNFFKNDLEYSTYFSGIKEDFKSEWKFHFDKKERINDIEVGDGTDYIMCGISYWTEKDGKIIKKALEDAVQNENFNKLYWDDVVNKCLKEAEVYITKIDSNDWFEIDSVKDLLKAEEYLKTFQW
ncbi:CTP:phosphocholine cytidylyltransferase [Clostridium amylolyticum]|uniref:CTP:phosphocholine cytidylyltransferase n=1 Tax=Clostridium amylolyticum TaxID=1121298 RepID=A0A1M6GY82_9CLOT|nr:sugar phosphate nucleotidyltransferase [Clostridium amylolyticum]SHJ14913.1 CTP:phosphocholine cytidylyltransferase [Clostridium amylolyticum]